MDRKLETRESRSKLQKDLVKNLFVLKNFYNYI